MFFCKQKWVSLLQQKAEALLWLGALLSMFFSHPVMEEHLTLCPLALAGFHWCPGCGVGRSMILALHGQVAASIIMHPLGLPAIAVLSERIYELFSPLNIH
ncbi:MAG: DUF2752 domain-containing protein [Bacteroidales bacterium]|nr:DUF2752 domain-containing protein [Bacteroidales bacterium]